MNLKKQFCYENRTREQKLRFPSVARDHPDPCGVFAST